jgi:hypothetical protein
MPNVTKNQIDKFIEDVKQEKQAQIGLEKISSTDLEFSF